MVVVVMVAATAPVALGEVVAYLVAAPPAMALGLTGVVAEVGSAGAGRWWERGIDWEGGGAE